MPGIENKDLEAECGGTDYEVGERKTARNQHCSSEDSLLAVGVVPVEDLIRNKGNGSWLCLVVVEETNCESSEYATLR